MNDMKEQNAGIPATGTAVLACRNVGKTFRQGDYSVQVLDNMPLNATGKVAKQVLRAWVAEPV